MALAGNKPQRYTFPLHCSAVNSRLTSLRCGDAPSRLNGAPILKGMTKWVAGMKGPANVTGNSVYLSKTETLLIQVTL